MSNKKSFSHANPAMSFISAVVDNEAQNQPSNAKAIKTQKLMNLGISATNVPMKRNPEFLEVKSKRMQLLMQPSLHQAIKQFADGEGMSVNDTIHRILKDYVEQHIAT